MSNYCKAPPDDNNVPNLAFMFDNNLQQVMFLWNIEHTKILGIQIGYVDKNEIVISNIEGITIKVIKPDGSIQRYP